MKQTSLLTRLDWSTKTSVLFWALIFLIVQLNFYFAWTSKAFNRSILIADEIYNFAKIQMAIPPLRSYFMNWALPICENNPSFCSASGCNNNVSCLAYDMATRFFIDYEALAFMIVIFCISFFLFYGKGIRTSFLRAFEITATAVLPLGLEMWIFDRSEFNVQTSVVQISTKSAWFTNADLLYGILIALLITLSLEGFRFARK
jgi:hypothetical protein